MTAEDRAHPVAGDMLAHYRVIKRLASGGMGEIYSAEDTRLGRRVALKVLPADTVAEEWVADAAAHTHRLMWC